jgi:8-oxo-dGTP pyrophosphatase MutT (NUDIX family)
VSPNTPIPEVLSSEIALRGFFDVRIDLLQLPRGPKRPYYSVGFSTHAAAILAYTTDNKLIATKEYRHPTGKWVLGCPGGRIDTGESPIEAAKRELLEETGYGNGTFSVLTHVHPLAALTDHQIYYILAQDVEYIQPPALEPFELIQVELKEEAAVYEEILKGYPVDGVLCTALFLKNIS